MVHNMSAEISMKRKLLVFAVVLVIATAGAVVLKFLIRSSPALEANFRQGIDRRAQVNLSRISRAA